MIAALAVAAGSVALVLSMTTVVRRTARVPVAWAVGASVACALIWAANVYVTSAFFVDVLRLDAWETVSIVERDAAGTLTLRDLIAPHNEHRPLTGRLVALACARWTDWNHWWEFGALHLVAALQLLVLAWAVGASRAPHTIRLPMLVACAACVCATTHWETWLRGFSVHILIGVLAPTTALLVLCHRGSGWLSWAAAGAAMVVGQLSFGAAWLGWPLGALVMAVRRQRSWQWQSAAWLAIAAIVTLLYVPGLQVHPGATANIGLTLSLRGMLRIVAGTFVSLGMAVFYRPSVFEGPDSLAQVP